MAIWIKKSDKYIVKMKKKPEKCWSVVGCPNYRATVPTVQA